jgi:hypothetical protein
MGISIMLFCGGFETACGPTIWARLIVSTRAAINQDLARRTFFEPRRTPDATRKRAIRAGPCIFFLTFFANNLIYESHCDFRIAKFDVRENQIDEERNQESRPEEESCSEEKEVAWARPRKRAANMFKLTKAPVFGAFFIV